jgi:ankyrin repeat protein/tetratricopeptide (TPR) repeat protein
MKNHPVIAICQIIAVSLVNLSAASYAQSPEQNSGPRHQVAKTRQSKMAQSYFNQGKSFVTKGKHKEAIIYFTKAIKIEPNVPNVYIYRAACYSRLDMFDLTIADCNRALALNPAPYWQQEAYYVRGHAYSKKELDDKALNDFKKVTEINPKRPDAYFRMATIYEKNGQLHESVHSYENFIKLAQSTDKRFHNAIMISKKKIKELSQIAKANAAQKPKALQMQEEWAKYQDVIDVLKIEVLKATRTQKSQPFLKGFSIREGKTIPKVKDQPPNPGTVFILMKIALRNTANEQRKFNSEHLSFRTSQGDLLEYANTHSTKTKDGMVPAYSRSSKALGILRVKESRPLDILLITPENYFGPVNIYYGEKLFTATKTKSKITQSKNKLAAKEKTAVQIPNQQLLDAAENGQIQKLKKVIAQGADVNFKNKYKETPLILACWKGHSACVKTLLDNGAKVNLRNSNGTPALGPATQAGHLKIIELLLAAGAPVNSRINNHGGTALMLAAIHGHTDATVLLLNRGANVEAKNNDGTTPCMFASMNGRLNILKILHDNGANINARDIHGATPLMFSAVKGYSDIAQYLIANGADVNAKLNSGSTALILATTNGHEKVVEILLKSGADVSVTDKMGQNAHSIAKQKKYHQILKLLERK